MSTSPMHTARTATVGKGLRNNALLWIRLWGGKPPNLGLLALAGITASLAVIPLAYILLRALEGGTGVWLPLLGERIPWLLWRSLRLAATTTALASAIAVPLAWLVVRTDLPGRRAISWLAALPLAFPPYVGAFAYITVFGPRGLFEKLVSSWTGVPGPELNLPKIYGLGGTTLILALFTYPYIYLLVGAALRSFNQSMEDAGRSLGLGPTGVFFRITLPLLRPALGAGVLLVALYALADFGAVAMLRHDTFTNAIFMQLSGRLDRSAAAALSVVLVILTLCFLWAEAWLESKGRYTQTSSSWRPARTVRLGAWFWPALVFVAVVLLAALGMPLGMLIYWSFEGFREGVDPKVWGYAWNTLSSAAGAATLASVLTFPVAYLAARHGGLISRGAFHLAYVGYAMPGVVVGLAVTFVFAAYLKPLYGTVWALLAAYLVRFLPQSLGSQHSSLTQIAPSLEEAARGCGHTPGSVIRRVTIPLMMPGILAGWSLVFLNTMKELPATLLLRPAGFDTLAVRIWIDASEGYFASAAPAALMLVVLALIPLTLLLGRVLHGRAKMT